MSQPQPSNDYSEYLPPPERRAPAPITNLPVNALTDDLDPTRDIRTLIDQLQISAKEARNYSRLLEEQKDDLAMRLTGALSQIDQLRANEREFRAQFVEITTLLRDRDEAVREADLQRSAAADLQRKLDGVVRERNDATRQRDDAVRQRDDSTRREAESAQAAQNVLEQFADLQRQVTGIRQARDAAQAASLVFTEKLARVEDEVAELQYQRDAAQARVTKNESEFSELRRQLGTITGDRDATAQQAADLTNELEVLRRQHSSHASASAEAAALQHSAALAEAREQLRLLAQEREAAEQRVQEQARELELERAAVAALRERQASAVSPEAFARLQEQLAELEAHRNEQIEEAAVQQERLTKTIEQLATTQRGREEALTSLQAAQKQIDHIIRDRDTVRAQQTQSALELEGKIVALEAQIVEVQRSATAGETLAAELDRKTSELRKVGQRFEKQRVDTIELGTRLEGAHREILELTASLAEARLALKFANGRAAHAVAPVIREHVASSVNTVEITLDPGTGDTLKASIARPLPLTLDIREPLSERDAKSALSAMRHCFQSFQKNPADISLLNELYSHAYGFSERARVSGYIALHRLSGAFSHLAQELYQFPEMVNASTLRTINQTIEFLITLTKDRNVAAIKDPAKALVYAVDDDLDNCESIKMALETAMLRTSFSQNPVAGLEEIASGRYDLIFLDVNLPQMDGFELCARIRQLAIHVNTPIVFLTGLATTENRVQSSLSGGTDFVGKPFNLYELSVKALTLILKSQLQIE